MGGSLQRVRTLETKRDGQGLTAEEQTMLNTAQENLEVLQEHYALMRSAGVTMVCGSDSAWGGYRMGQFHYEFEGHVLAGMKPMEAIVASTKDAARSCWIDEEVGTLEPGKRADVVVVDGNPSREATALRSVVDVFQSGRVVDRRNLV
jgi:imidazolonepropionase-like amidohydrolase